MKFDHFELDFDKKVLSASGVIPRLEFKCHYNLDGKILLLAIKGEGNSNITLANCYAKYRSFYEEFTKNGETFYKKLRTETETTADRWYFHFDNLFDGNKELGDNINLVMNDNWKEIADELQPEYNEIVGRIMTSVSEKIWLKKSLEEYFDRE